MLRTYRDGASPFTERKAPRDLAQRIVTELGVETPSLKTEVGKLSGGNVQKILVGRELVTAPTVLLTAYAVRGLDVNSSLQVYELLNRQKGNGVAVVYAGEDLDVLLELCDRILVLCGGKVSAILDGRSTSKEEVGLMMTRLRGGES
jgi:simple sugar transport system ATP-binding protein